MEKGVKTNLKQQEKCVKYKINHSRCYLISCRDTVEVFRDWTLYNEYLGIALGSLIYYVGSILFFPLFLILGFVWYVKRIYKIKKRLPYLDIDVINRFKREEIIKEIKEKTYE